MENLSRDFVTSLISFYLLPNVRNSISACIYASSSVSNATTPL